MKHLIVLVAFSIMLLSCSSNDKDQAFCDCMKVGKEFNEVSKKVLTSRADKSLANKFLSLKKEKKKLCEKYETMGGKELFDKKQACENN